MAVALAGRGWGWGWQTFLRWARRVPFLLNNRHPPPAACSQPPPAAIVLLCGHCFCDEDSHTSHGWADISLRGRAFYDVTLSGF